MNVGAVICEYNPFHFGHAYQLSKMKKRGAVVAVMSGSFTQRGEAALLSKYERAEIAVRCGADLVLELPFPYCASNAEVFGAAGVALADALGCVDELCFGSETADVETLKQISSRLSSSDFTEAMEAHLQKNGAHTYRTSVRAIYRLLFGEEMPLGSNDILALSYLSALEKCGSKIEPIAVMRKGERFNGEGEGFASATTVRAYLKNGDLSSAEAAVPQVCAEKLVSAYQNGRLAHPESLFSLFAGLVRARGEGAFSEIYDVPAGLRARLCRFAFRAKDEAAFISSCVSKNDSPSRVRRAMLAMLLDVKKTDVLGVSYTTVLAANETGRALLSEIRRTARIPIITKPADAKKREEIADAFALASRADAVWELLHDVPREGNAMMREKPRML